ncbi:MAG TPA: hypothetical protein VI386_25120, partial [Candidatus Sulfotelmatobacter sp.]
MPGIAGIITRHPRAWAEPQLARMVEEMRHESFYRTGTCIDESLGIYSGWTALKNSLGDSMPVANERGDISLIFSGEEYSGSRSGERPASCLAQRAESERNFPASLNGMFHGLLLDRRRGTATLFNDRYGMHRLYYHQSKDAFYFAGEAKAILAVCPELRTPSPQGLGEFVAVSCVLENRTIFRDIQVLPAASAWTFRDGALEQKRAYFDPREWESQSALDSESYYQELRQALAGTLPNYF